MAKGVQHICKTEHQFLSLEHLVYRLSLDSVLSHLCATDGQLHSVWLENSWVAQDDTCRSQQSEQGTVHESEKCVRGKLKLCAHSSPSHERLYTSYQVDLPQPPGGSSLTANRS